MTDISTLAADRELDALVAEKVMGLRSCQFSQVGSISGMMTMWRCQHPNSHACYPANSEAIDHGHSPLIHYSTDIAAAWQVVTAMVHKGFDVRLIGSKEMGWQCQIDWPGCESHYDSENSAPLAICRAALAVVGGSSNS